MQQVPKASILHEFIEKQISMWGKRIALQADKVSMFYPPHSIKLSLEFTSTLLVIMVKLLDCKRLSTLQNALVNCARCPKTNDIPLAQVIS